MEIQTFLNCFIKICTQYFSEELVVSLPPHHGQNLRVSGEGQKRSLLQETRNLGNILLQELVTSGQWSLFVYRGPDEGSFQTQVEEIYHRPSSYIIYLQNNVTSDLKDRLRRLKTFYFRNLRSRFVVILDEKFKEPEAKVSEVLTKLWQFKIVNVVVLLKLRKRDILQIGVTPKGLEQLLQTRQPDTAVGVYTWFPYRDRSNCHNTREVHLVDLWVMEGSGHFALNNYLFPNKIKNSLNNCPLVVSTTQRYPFVGDPDFYTNADGSTEAVYSRGWDINLLNIVRDAMNVSLRFLPPSVEQLGRLLDNGTYVGVVGDLTYSKTDIALSGLPLVAPFTDRGDHTAVYSRSEFIWLVPCARRLLGWRNVFRMFSYSLWLCIFLSLILAAGVTCFLAKLSLCAGSRGIARYSNLSETSCNILAVFLGVGVSSIPRASAVRIFLLAWICHCMAVNTVIQSYFTAFLVKSDLEKQVSSVDEILNSGMDYGFIPQFDIFFAVDRTTLNKNVLRDRKDCTHMWSCLRRLAYERDFAMLLSEVTYETDVKYKFLDKQTSRPLVCRIPETFVSFYYSLYTPKGHHLLDRIDSVLSRIFQAGLYSELQELDAHVLRVAVQVSDKEGTDDEYYPFSLQHLRVVFCILLAGHAMSLLVLLLEMLFWSCARVR
jgi:glutamate receptor delta-2 subunit